MAGSDGVLSIKIVSVDHYSAFPINNLDVTYSEFRGSAVKQVPLIRIFGITQNKKKICANVHNVFPYLYIPCPETNAEKVTQMMQQIAIQLDKSINTSLGKSNSESQHVYRVSLVKGIPFYGFHQSEHQFFRIQLYNPNLIKRTASLLQNGTILGKSFQPHESHIPYILKFFIDYNLFGMSYLHVPLQFVNTRQDDDSRTRFRKKAISQIEVDFKAIYILNRVAAMKEDDAGKAANPGIESIWEDERMRRSLMNSDSVPSLEQPISQPRDTQATDSDIFFRMMLKERLASKSTGSPCSTSLFTDDTISSPATSEKHQTKKKFNLNNFLDASVYAAEFSQTSHSTKSSQDTDRTLFDSQAIEKLEEHFLNCSESFDDMETEMKEDKNLLEEHMNDDEENDSILAPLSQTLTIFSKSSVPNETLPCGNRQTSRIDNNSSDSDDEIFNDLNVTVADMEIFSQYVKEDDKNNSIPQLDGADNDIEDIIDYKIKLRNISPTETTMQADRERNLYPRAGPSNLYISPMRLPIKIQAPSPSVSIINNLDVQEGLRNLAKECILSKQSSPPSINSSDEDDSENSLLKSFYNQTMIDDFQSSDDSETEVIPEQELNDRIKIEKGLFIAVTPAIEPPDPSTVLDRLSEFGIPLTVNPIPHYSDPKDLTKKKEVGYNILEIPGNRLNDYEDFESQIFHCNQLDDFRIDLLKNEAGINKKIIKSSASIKNYLSSGKCVFIHPCQEPPSYENAVEWLKSDSKHDQQNEEQSPIKMKREKILMVLKQDDCSESSNENFNMIPTPTTSNVPDTIPSSLEKEQVSLSEFYGSGINLSYSARRRRSKMKKSFSRRLQEIMKSRVESEIQNSSQSLSETTESPEVFESSQSNIDSEYQSDTTLNSSIIVKNANVQEDLTFSDSRNITGPSLNNTYGFKMKLESLQSNDEHTDLTILSMELHVQTRNQLKPNPEFDAISAIFFSLDGFYVDGEVTSLNGIIACLTKSRFKYTKPAVQVTLVETEMDLIETFFKKVHEWDPDIFAGYEIESASWGYLIQRGCILNMNLINALSRMPMDDRAEKGKTAPLFDEDDQHDMGDYYSEQKIPGRILLDVWRLMRHEIALTSYTFENICYHVLHRRYAKHSFSHLTSSWNVPLKMWIVADYYCERTRTLIEILKQLDLIGRTCELAKLFGIQFYEVLSRGSQFRVESMMIRIAKRRNYVPVSPSVQQRAHMRAPEYIPLILEPQSRFYSDPVIVLDFQSLYPSIIIAYNYCFSTCLGRVEFLSKASSQPFEFGAYQLRITPIKLKHFLDNDLVNVSPCGVAYVKSSVREGVLPRMLREILDTRLMVKQSMKIHKTNSALQRLLHSRQLGLKLIANVTYGYTAANFSGRMPAIEVGDSVVSKGRETLERAIKMVEENKEWGCRVCYGDTDSMFVLVPGRSREQAFEIGEQIAKAVTGDNPSPIKLKLEKVYQPCILQTKKRYVGYMYETVDQKDPVYEAKGIETVRRDGCPAAAKILEKTLKILFDTCDVSKVKEYVCRQFTKILTGQCSIQDLVFAKEFRGINGYKPKACVPALALTRKWKLSDPRDEPRRGERVPFVVVNGAPGLPLIKLIKSPLEVLMDDSLRINSIYYITKVIIPPLNRCLLLIGANAFDWFAELPRKQQLITYITKNSAAMNKKGVISEFFNVTSCATDCGCQCTGNLCSKCKNDPQQTVTIISDKIWKLERRFTSVQKICESCCRRGFDTDCISVECPILYAAKSSEKDYKQTEFYRDILNEFF